MRLKKRFARQESTFISPRYKRWERRYDLIQKYLNKKRDNIRNAIENRLGLVYDSELYAQSRAMLIDVMFTWFVVSVIMLCIKQPFTVGNIISTLVLSLGIAVLTPVVQYYIRWFFQVKEKPFR